MLQEIILCYIAMTIIITFARRLFCLSAKITQKPTSGFGWDFVGRLAFGQGPTFQALEEHVIQCTVPIRSCHGLLMALLLMCNSSSCALRDRIVQAL